MRRGQTRYLWRVNIESDTEVWNQQRHFQTKAAAENWADRFKEPQISSWDEDTEFVVPAAKRITIERSNPIFFASDVAGNEEDDVQLYVYFDASKVDTGV